MTKTIILKSERLVISRPGKAIAVLCRECAGGMLMLEEAVVVAAVSSRVIYRRVEAGAVHFAETPNGLLLICLNSLVGSIDTTAGS